MSSQEGQIRQPAVHLSQLDGIKGIISIFIIFVHYNNRTSSGIFPISWMPMVLVKKAWIFVEFFFIISGFLFAYSNKTRTQNMEFGPYLKARLKRLYPPVFFVLLLDIVVRIVDICVLQGGSRLTVENVLGSLTFASTWLYNAEPLPTVVWYIHVLLLCYVVYYFIARTKDPTNYLLGIIGLMLFGWVLYAAELDLPFLYQNIGRGYLSFSVGLLIYEFQIRVSERMRRRVSVGAIILAVLSLGGALLSSFSRVYGDLLLACTLFLFPAAMLALLNLRWVGRIFSWKPLVWLGKVSMATFLVHVPVLNLFNILCYRSGALPFDELSSFVIIMLTIFAVSAAWYYLVEKKLIPAWLQRIEREA